MRILEHEAVVCVVPVGSDFLQFSSAGSGLWAPQHPTSPGENPAEHPLDGQERPTPESLAGHAVNAGLSPHNSRDFWRCVCVCVCVTPDCT